MDIASLREAYCVRFVVSDLEKRGLYPAGIHKRLGPFSSPLILLPEISTAVHRDIPVPSKHRRPLSFVPYRRLSVQIRVQRPPLTTTAHFSG